ncbi:hypothetical protein K438DRAFT_1761498 [Mycena galopus ATCC 62051]|nr:hypothetical protein K438DRAFT_1761498 [Mycena galopus ATCC 62051]
MPDEPRVGNEVRRHRRVHILQRDPGDNTRETPGAKNIGYGRNPDDDRGFGKMKNEDSGRDAARTLRIMKGRKPTAAQAKRLKATWRGLVLSLYENVHLQATPNDVTLVARKWDSLIPFPGHTIVQFCSISEKATAAQQHQVEFVDTASYENHYHVTRLATGLSGRCAVILDMEPPYTKGILGVVQYTPQPTPRTSFHPLDTGDVEFDPWAVLVVDDALGVVYAIRGAEPKILYMFAYA